MGLSCCRRSRKRLLCFQRYSGDSNGAFYLAGSRLWQGWSCIVLGRLCRERSSVCAWNCLGGFWRLPVHCRRRGMLVRPWPHESGCKLLYPNSTECSKEYNFSSPKKPCGRRNGSRLADNLALLWRCHRNLSMWDKFGPCRACCWGRHLRKRVVFPSQELLGHRLGRGWVFQSLSHWRPRYLRHQYVPLLALRQ